jgi:hypothetical protein
MMKLAIMQPYFFPYIGYFQLIKSVDQFVVHDNIKYTKKGWINRNRILRNGQDVIFSLPLKNDSDSLDIGRREIAANFNRNKLLNQIIVAYKRAPYFEQTYSLIERIILYEDNNLFRFLHNSIVTICRHLLIDTEIKVSSETTINYSLKGQDKVLALCIALGATTYVNAIGGVGLYSKDTFLDKGVELKFINSKPFEYAQFGDNFIPWLSIIDVMMFNSVAMINECWISHYELI